MGIRAWIDNYKQKGKENSYRRGFGWACTALLVDNWPEEYIENYIFGGVDDSPRGRAFDDGAFAAMEK